jgi:hypothetical protein
VSEDLPDTNTLVMRAASCLNFCMTHPKGRPNENQSIGIGGPSVAELRSESEKELRKCFSLAADGAAGIPLAEYERRVKQETANMPVQVDADGSDHYAAAAEIDIALAKIIG